MPTLRPNETHFSARHVVFLDYDRIYFKLERFKAERGWYNLNLTHHAIKALLADQGWYRLQIPEEELTGDSFEKVRLWEEIAVSLLKKYTERYYVFRKREWELPHLEYRTLEGNDPNFLGVKGSPDEGYYRILIDKSQEEIVAKLGELKTAIEKGDLKPWEFQGMKTIWFGKHLYQPLIYLDNQIVKISPAPLNKGECRFVEDLKAFHDGHADFFETRELYLLRNLSKGRGVGFFEAGNFHPDFILWLLADGSAGCHLRGPQGDPQPRAERSEDPVLQRPSRRSNNAWAIPPCACSPSLSRTLRPRRCRGCGGWRRARCRGGTSFFRKRTGTVTLRQCSMGSDDPSTRRLAAIRL